MGLEWVMGGGMGMRKENRIGSLDHVLIGMAAAKVGKGNFILATDGIVMAKTRFCELESWALCQSLIRCFSFVGLLYGHFRWGYARDTPDELFLGLC